MFTITNSIGLFGMNAFPVTVEAEVVRGHVAFDIGGLPDAGIRESRDRVRSALSSVSIPFPRSHVVMNLAPADVRKSGTTFDLAMFAALLQTLGVLPPRMPERVFIGELGLGGKVHGIRGVMSMVMLAQKLGFTEAFVPHENVREASVVEGIRVYGVESAGQLLGHLDGSAPLSPAPLCRPTGLESAADLLDFCDVRGQDKARRGVELAAAGGHNLLLVGAPGSGKSMLANRIPTILPKMTHAEILETTSVYSVAGLLSAEDALIARRPFRAPHHTVSAAGLVGGGSIPAPGEISLAHNGVLFLDELAEFDRSTLEILRQPLESREVTISRAAGTAVYPCSIMLVAAMNPCPCGYYGSKTRQCTCSPAKVKAYLGKISGPLLDRFDLQIDVDPVAYDDLAGTEPTESSETIRTRIEKARERQAARFHDTEIYCNAMIPDHMLRQYCKMDDAAQVLLRTAHERYGISARTYSRIQKVALSAADLNGHDTIQKSDIASAIQFRGLESKYLN